MTYRPVFQIQEFLASLAYYSRKGGDIDLLVLTLEKVLSPLHHCVQRLVFNENYQRTSS